MTGMNRLQLTLRRVRRTLLVRRRLLAGVLAASAVAVGLQATSPASPSTRTVVVAARDLPGGTVLRGADLTTAELSPGAVPHGVVEGGDALGRTTAAPLRSGEVVTDVRLVSGDLLAGYPGDVAAPVRIADAGSVALLRVGDRVDVLAADPQGGTGAVVVAERAPVVALPRSQQSTLAPGGLVVLAVDSATAAELAAAGVSHYLSLVLTR